MNKLSIVLITFNAQRKLKQVLQKAASLSNDIIVLDSGSTDGTNSICKEFKVSFHQQEWLGYGKQKNLANQFAKYDWILSIDADEILSDDLLAELETINLKAGHVYEIPFKNIYCGQKIRFGRWKNERHIRLFNKKEVQWNENGVHEGLNWKGLKKEVLLQAIVHYSMDSKAVHIEKAQAYAKMSAEKLKLAGKKATFIKRYINPFYRFVFDYFFSLGFLDGKIGLQIASIIAKETYWKYRYLKQIS
jgi:glycosyltransferase involved in cell wall biosynthesis